MEVIALLVTVLYVGVLIYLVTLAARFVLAIESIASRLGAIDRIADKLEQK